MRIRLILLAGTCAAALALTVAPAWANSITISTSSTSGGGWSGGVFTPTTPTTNATLNVAELETNLQAGNVVVGSTSSTDQIVVDTSVFSSSSNNLSFEPQAEISENGDSITTTGSQTYGAPLDVEGATTLSASSGVALESVTGSGALTVDGPTALDGGSAITGGDQDYKGAVTINADTTFGSTGSGDLTFGSTLDGTYALTLATAGSTTFKSSVGASLELTRLAVDDGGSVTVEGSEVATSGAQDYGSGTLTIGAATKLSSTGGQITSSGPIVYQRDLTIYGGGTLSGTASGAGALDKEGSGRLTLAGGGSAPNSVFVEGGTLDVTGSVPGAVSAYGGTSVDVSGTVGGEVDVKQSATLNCDDGTIDQGVENEGGTATGAPAAPTAVSATPGAVSAANVAFTPGTANCFPVRYTVSSSPSTNTVTGSSSPLALSPLAYWTPYTFTVTATNPVGSATSTASSPLTISSGPPQAVISSPANGQTYPVGESVPTDFGCDEATGGMGLTSCDDSNGTASVAGGSGRLDTSTPGTFAYTVIATSRDGESGTASITYTVTAGHSTVPSNRFSVSKIRTHRHGTVTLTVSVAGAGRIALVETAGRMKLARLSAHAGRAGAVNLTVRLSKHERHLLAGRHRLKARLSVTFTPNGGEARTVRSHTFALKLA